MLIMMMMKILQIWSFYPLKSPVTDEDYFDDNDIHEDVAFSHTFGDTARTMEVHSKRLVTEPSTTPSQPQLATSSSSVLREMRWKKSNS